RTADAKEPAHRRTSNLSHGVNLARAYSGRAWDAALEDSARRRNLPSRSALGFASIDEAAHPPHPRDLRMSKVRLEHEGPLAVLTLDSPPLNLFEHELIGELIAAVDTLTAEPPRGLLVRAEGRVVSGGVDVHEFDGLTRERAAELWERLLGLVHRVEELPLPTVFAAHGLCLTAAFELSLGCDLLLAAQSARFGLVETVVGLTPAMGGTQRLAERAGPARARELVMTGELYDAAT